jgi:hypothetical protein
MRLEGIATSSDGTQIRYWHPAGRGAFAVLHIGRGLSPRDSALSNQKLGANGPVPRVRGVPRLPRPDS